jgi:hypothetical protein
MQRASQSERVHNTNDGLLTLLAASERGQHAPVHIVVGAGAFGLWDLHRHAAELRQLANFVATTRPHHLMTSGHGPAR